MYYWGCLFIWTRFGHFSNDIDWSIYEGYDLDFGDGFETLERDSLHLDTRLRNWFSWVFCLSLKGEENGTTCDADLAYCVDLVLILFLCSPKNWFPLYIVHIRYTYMPSLSLSFLPLSPSFFFFFFFFFPLWLSFNYLKIICLLIKKCFCRVRQTSPNVFEETYSNANTTNWYHNFENLGFDYIVPYVNILCSRYC